MNYERVETEVLIIGAGAAGLRTAIELAENGVEVLVVSDRGRGDAHTKMAAGGINASLGTRDPDDDWTYHAADTLREGHFLGRPEAVELLAQRAPDRIRELADWGCPFARTDDGGIDQRYFGAQSYRRTCFVGDRTGEAILETLLDRAKRLEIRHRDDVSIVEILAVNNRASGAIGWSSDSSTPLVLRAAAVVVAAGGFTGVYQRHTSRANENLGDSVGLAYRAGATLRDMEFVQFHPTGMVEPEEMKGRLVTEAVRGEGGRLFDVEGRRFMEDYAPEEMELAARDVVARAIADVLAQGGGTEQGGVYLDISHRDGDFVRHRLPRIYERYQQFDIDITEEPIEVAPTAHYTMGGIEADPKTGGTGVDGLFAVGEAAAGVHGANRLGGNSLAETVVFGQLVGARLSEWINGRTPTEEISDYYVRQRLEHWAGKANQDGRHHPDEIISELRRITEEHAGIVRDGDGLRGGLDRLGALRRNAADLQVSTAPGSEAFRRLQSMEFMLDTVEMMMTAALMREESRGAHHREDFSATSESWRVSITCHRAADDSPALERHPVEEASPPVREALQRDLHLDYHHLE